MSGTLAPMTMNADEALINAPYCQVQCLGCTDWRSDRVKAAIGKFYLANLACEKVAAPPLDQLLRKCCKNAADQTSITY